jgi:hypothetical protein
MGVEPISPNQGGGQITAEMRDSDDKSGHEGVTLPVRLIFSIAEAAICGRSASSATGSEVCKDGIKVFRGRPGSPAPSGSIG